MSKNVQILVSGKVQGVGFRNFVAAHAEALGIRGWVRNLSDGRVEVLAEIADEVFENFCSHVRQGPSRSHIEDFTVHELNGAIDADGFSVEKDGGEPWSQN